MNTKEILKKRGEARKLLEDVGPDSPKFHEFSQRLCKDIEDHEADMYSQFETLNQEMEEMRKKF